MPRENMVFIAGVATGVIATGTCLFLYKRFCGKDEKKTSNDVKKIGSEIAKEVGEKSNTNGQFLELTWPEPGSSKPSSPRPKFIPNGFIFDDG